MKYFTFTILFHPSISRLRQLEQAQFEAIDENAEENRDRGHGNQGNDTNDPDDRERIYEQVRMVTLSVNFLLHSVIFVDIQFLKIILFF